ncbi:hypothetical protein BUY46_02585 [Staphylococcus devriesei]|nr:hypothetical protein BUY46_02585 [Staphylococcus devriesei]
MSSGITVGLILAAIALIIGLFKKKN